jgi:hypothetical protein
MRISPQKDDPEVKQVTDKFKKMRIHTPPHRALFQNLLGNSVSHRPWGPAEL